MGGADNLFCSSKFPRARDRISSKFIENLGTRLQKRSLGLHYIFPTAILLRLLCPEDEIIRWFETSETTYQSSSCSIP